MRSQIPVDWTVYFFPVYQLGSQAVRITTLTFETSIEPRFDASARAAPGPAPVAILASSGELEEDCQADLTCQRRLLLMQLKEDLSERLDLPRCLLD